jgi:hypothetical protein
VDLAFGNTVTFVFVAGVLALQGNKLAGLVSVALFVLMPRPLAVPLVAWLLWRNPDWRLPALWIVVIHGLAVLATGYTADWLIALSSAGSSQLLPHINWGPTQLVGWWWFVVGVPIGAWLFWRGRVGLAGLALSPYILPHYVLMILWDLRRRESSRP